MNAAERLFKDLLRDQRKISYIDAYEILVGERPERWDHRVHCRRVLSIAQESGVEVVEGLSVRLDALIVNRAGNQEPSEGHFKSHEYTRQQWRQVFQFWKLAQADAYRE